MEERQASRPNSSAPFLVRGLTSEEVERRRARGEVNRVSSATSRRIGSILRSNTFTLFNAILAGAVVLLLAVGQVRDAVLISALVVFSVSISIFQEIRAKVRLDRIALLARAPVTVIRDGRSRSVDPAELVLGDYLTLSRGDQVVVDGPLVIAQGLEIDESLLTGESEPVIKKLGDRVLSGSFCVAGTGVYVAEQVGEAGYAQRLASAARTFRNPRTPIQRLVDQVLRALVVAVVSLSALQTAVFVSQGTPLVDAVRATAVIATLVPQGLLFMSTVAYSVGAVRLAQTGALVQQLNAVESLSHIDVLCLDKTGTLTANRLRLKDVVPVGEDRGEVEGLVAAFAASFPDPNPTLLAIAAALPSKSCSVVAVIPFSSERRWSALTFAPSCRIGTLVLGAPDRLLGQAPNSTDLLQENDRLARAGLRVLLLARVHSPLTSDGDVVGVPERLQALALVVLEEEVRPEARETLDQFARAGVAIKVISGDDPQTALGVGRRVGLPESAQATTWAELAALPPRERSAALDSVTVFGRVSPQEKQEIVKGLEANGHYLAMIGDGVNDVLGLKQANVSIAMRSGSPAARAVSDVVLIEDSFDVLPKGVEEGRKIVNSMLLLIKLFLIRDVATIGLILASSLVGAPFPLVPPQAAVLGLLTVGVPALLVVAWASPAVPRPQSLRDIAVVVLQLGATSALAITSVYFLTLTGFDGNVAQARSAVTTAAMVSGVLILVLFWYPLDVPLDELLSDRRIIALAAMIMAVYVVGLYSPTVQRLAELTPLSLVDWIVILPIVLGWFGLLRLVVRCQGWRRTR